MPDNRFHQPLSRSGFTLMELVIGIAVAAVVGLVSAGLFKAGLKTYNYSYRQTSVLAGARRALSGSGSLPGVIWAAQSASSVTALSGSSLTLAPPSASSITYQVSGGNLYQTTSGVRTLQSVSVSSAVFSYYNLDSSGLIMVSTLAANATFVTMQLTLTGKSANDRTYNFLGGAQLRNHP